MSNDTNRVKVTLRALSYRVALKFCTIESAITTLLRHCEGKLHYDGCIQRKGKGIGFISKSKNTAKKETAMSTYCAQKSLQSIWVINRH